MVGAVEKVTPQKGGEAGYHPWSKQNLQVPVAEAGRILIEGDVDVAAEGLLVVLMVVIVAAAAVLMVIMVAVAVAVAAAVWFWWLWWLWWRRLLHYAACRDVGLGLVLYSRRGSGVRVGWSGSGQACIIVLCFLCLKFEVVEVQRFIKVCLLVIVCCFGFWCWFSKKK